jgi:hypothetical protein
VRATVRDIVRSEDDIAVVVVHRAIRHQAIV